MATYLITLSASDLEKKAHGTFMKDDQSLSSALTEWKSENEVSEWR